MKNFKIIKKYFQVTKANKKNNVITYHSIVINKWTVYVYKFVVQLKY